MNNLIIYTQYQTVCFLSHAQFENTSVTVLPRLTDNGLILTSETRIHDPQRRTIEQCFRTSDVCHAEKKTTRDRNRVAYGRFVRNTLTCLGEHIKFCWWPLHYEIELNMLLSIYLMRLQNPGCQERAICRQAGWHRYYIENIYVAFGSFMRGSFRRSYGMGHAVPSQLYDIAVHIYILIYDLMRIYYTTRVRHYLSSVLRVLRLFGIYIPVVEYISPMLDYWNSLKAVRFHVTYNNSNFFFVHKIMCLLQTPLRVQKREYNIPWYAFHLNAPRIIDKSMLHCHYIVGHFDYPILLYIVRPCAGIKAGFRYCSVSVVNTGTKRKSI